MMIQHLKNDMIEMRKEEELRNVNVAWTKRKRISCLSTKSFLSLMEVVHIQSLFPFILLVLLT
jgi:hypothetical protein